MPTARDFPRTLPPSRWLGVGGIGATVLGWIVAHTTSVWILCGELDSLSGSGWMCAAAVAGVGLVGVAALGLLSHDPAARHEAPRVHWPLKRAVPLLVLASLAGEALVDHAFLGSSTTTSSAQVAAVAAVHALTTILSLLLWRETARTLLEAAVNRAPRLTVPVARLLVGGALGAPVSRQVVRLPGRSPPDASVVAALAF